MAPLTNTYSEQQLGAAVLVQVVEFIVEHFDPTALYRSEIIKQHVQDEYEPRDVFIHHDFLAE